MIQYGIIILAAGGSSRLGKPKQLLPYRRKSLLANITIQALAVPDTFTIVVTGAENEAVEEELKATGVATCYNAAWVSGMSSSIQKGLLELKNRYEVKACIVAVCDQPFVTTAILNNLIKKHIVTGKGIIASSYAGVSGTPSLFSKKYFEDLLHLEGNEGAKKLLAKYESDVLTVPFNKGEIDIDTPEDYDNLIRSAYPA
ncbi:MAG: nucleotidyltransferase family protein [Flavitalea sp.]